MSDASPILIRTTRDGRRVEVIGPHLCLDGRREATGLVPIDEHPNRQAILAVVPDATHVGGRLPLTMAEASVAQAALRRAQEGFDGTPQAARERMRRALWHKALAGEPD